MNAVARSALARIASFVPTALATLLTSRLVIEHYGVVAFDSFALILALINLIPLNNLGVGASVTAAYAQRDADPDHVHRTVLTASRVLAISTIGTAAASALLGVLHLWPDLLGDASGPNFWCAVAMVFYALTFLPGLGQSVLLGVHRNHITILVQAFFNPLVAVLVGAAILAGVSAGGILVVPCVALIIIHGITAWAAARSVALSWWSVMRELPNRRRHPGTSIRSMSGPVLIITLATPIALQSDRIVLSHVSSTQAVADYSIAFQIFAPALVLIAASAQPLWPIYTQARSEGKRGPSVVRMISMFCGIGAVVGAVLALIANPMASLIGGHHVHVSPLLAFSGALAVVTAAASYPVAMSLMDPIGVRFVVWCTAIALPLNIGLSVVLGKGLGAPGPLLASCIVGILVQAVPGLVYSRDRQTAGRHRRSRYGPSPMASASAVATLPPPVVLEQLAD
ncbi:MAG: lipopolysaccharide biosynthesis protein [Jatrophihabitans sp.]|uniref:lipopolysaccharide biosynthesis protein n=1 Tax=Jatrophihabitans sp. TaxID=1932789 RepID=UPI0039143394